MATFSAIFSPAGARAGGGAQDTQKVSALATVTSSSALSIGIREKIVVVVVPTPGGTAPVDGANIRFTLSTSTASSTASAADFMIPLNAALTFDMSDAFDQVSFFNPNGAGMTLDVYVMRLAN